VRLISQVKCGFVKAKHMEIRQLKCPVLVLFAVSDGFVDKRSTHAAKNSHINLLLYLPHYPIVHGGLIVNIGLWDIPPYLFILTRTCKCCRGYYSPARVDSFGILAGRTDMAVADHT